MRTYNVFNTTFDLNNSNESYSSTTTVIAINKSQHPNFIVYRLIKRIVTDFHSAIENNTK